MLTSDQLMDVYEQMIEKYPFYSIEDPFQEEDIQAWQKFTEKFGDQIQIVGDDLLVTNTTKLSQAIEGAWCNAILIKPNQIGTVSETLKAISMAKNEAFNVVISHRSGETDDTFISDLALVSQAGKSKLELQAGESVLQNTIDYSKYITLLILAFKLLY